VAKELFPTYILARLVGTADVKKPKDGLVSMLPMTNTSLYPGLAASLCSENITTVQDRSTVRSLPQTAL